VAAELEARPQHAEAELRRLQTLLPEVNVPRGDARAALRTLNAAFVERLSRGEVPGGDEAVRAHLRETLADALGVLSPRFDTSLDIED